jgi:protein-tyrosine phosphatase
MRNLPEQLDFEGAHNFRDMGGYPLQDERRVRRGKLFRSDHLGKLTDADQVLLKELGIRTVVDLRRQEERDEALDRVDHPGVEHIWMPVMAEAADVVSLRRSLERGEMSAHQAHDFLVLANRQFVEVFSQVFSEFLHLLLEPEKYPLVFHCSAGKDRAGYAAAMSLFAIGASEETVLHDYLATNHCNANYVDGLVDGVNDMPGIDVSGDALRMLMQVRPEFLGEALGIISREHGGIHAYLERELDFGQDKRERLRSLLAE